MNYWQKGLVIGITTLSLFTGSLSAFAQSATNAPSVYINGKLEWEAIQQRNRTFVPLAALKDPAWSIGYEAKTRSVVLSSPGQKKTIQLKQGQKSAEVNGKTKALDAAVIMKDGRTYVPLRFISEELNAFVSYNKERNRVVIRTPEGQRDYDTLMGGDLAKAREVAVGLQLVYDNTFKELPVTGEGFTTTHTFPKGEALRLLRDYKGMTWYAEVNEEGLLTVKWQKDALGDKKEAGVPPKPFPEAVFFSENPMVELLIYGTVNKEGVYEEAGRIDQGQAGAYQNARIVPVEGEERTDRRH
ncbi:copper amine oxidase N-terminal domain-containing protein [Paenibacillus sp. alder61]|uniref:copper amine oxidase N-terminal domain-containing protein n=1 Tax=Paenibacillus sp. alder61 TaxID=2862948 RepID=UPI001CD698D7|nr:copper amine oxidase N-terminal domain-containing protein [Paenibacillus sp. alder61]MCA1295156.1 copper amine oxidase N-terminal domain-containing protein [Paenibacillus sp. alder61]